MTEFVVGVATRGYVSWGFEGTLQVAPGRVTLRRKDGRTELDSPASELSLWTSDHRLNTSIWLVAGGSRYVLRGMAPPTVANTNKYGGWAALQDQRSIDTAVLMALLGAGVLQLDRKPPRRPST